MSAAHEYTCNDAMIDPVGVARLLRCIRAALEPLWSICASNGLVALTLWAHEPVRCARSGLA
jgi:hypothetical protein